ncbi:MAG: histidinol-phosphatase [Spirochaetaceae bacterium]|jgi:histidinol-phosphatase (PHP family)|nr:histidinol-phosphatase [Spirochaetaceae bacterium]
MRFANFHTHTEFCDGTGTPEDYCREALKAGLAALGFSAHAPLTASPVPVTNWHLPARRFPEYRAAVHACKETYAGRLPVFLGLEADYIAGIQSPRDYAGRGLDYLIGSVHCVIPPHFLQEAGRSPQDFFTKAGGMLCIDGTPEEWVFLVDAFFAGNVWALVDAYWEQQLLMIETGGFDILGHSDLIKKNNLPGLIPRRCLFDETDIRYTRCLTRIADALAGSGITAEINTGGINRGRTTETYPSAAFLHLLCERGVPITINSDAHAPEQVAGGYAAAVQTARTAGYTEACLKQPFTPGIKD